MKSKEITVMVADDNALVRSGIISFIKLESGLRLVGEAVDGSEAIARWRETRPEVTLMDLHMPVLDGVDAITEIRAEDPKALIVILTTYDGEADIFRGVSAGAKGYVLKDIEPRLLMECIRQVAAGGAYIPTLVAMKLSTHLANEALTARGNRSASIAG